MSLYNTTIIAVTITTPSPTTIPYTTSALIEMNLAGNLIGDMGAEALAGALLINSTLVKLDLSDNKIGPQGCIMLASVGLLQP